jgi:hypothetical protein
MDGHTVHRNGNVYGARGGRAMTVALRDLDLLCRPGAESHGNTTGESACEVRESIDCLSCFVEHALLLYRRISRVHSACELACEPCVGIGRRVCLVYCKCFFCNIVPSQESRYGTAGNI